MRPAPLQPLAIEVHLGSVAVDDYPLVLADKLLEGLAFATEEDSEHCEHWCDRNPQPGFALVLLGW